MVAELTKMSEKNGHRYLDLADSENGTTTALASAHIWRTAFDKIEAKTGPDLHTILQLGNKILFELRIEYHRIHGLKLNVLDIDPNYSYGEIERKKQETIQRLKDEGLFDLQKNLYLPVIAKKIALIGSPGTSGFRDFLNELKHNEVYRNFSIKEFPVSVQGDKAAPEIIAALKEAQSYNVDVIILLRGGGSKMDLNVFNDYELSKTICQSRVPVLTGIGHETDETVADLVCRLKCITPTAAAKWLYVQIGIFSAELRKAYDAVRTLALGQVTGYKDEFYHTCSYFAHFSRQFLFEHQVDLQENSHDLQLGFLGVIQNERKTLDLRQDRIQGQAVNLIHLIRETDLPSRIDKMLLHSENIIGRNRIELDNLAEKLELLNPIRLLESGYTLSTIDDTDIHLLKGDLTGKEMKTLTTNAIITSTITKTEKK